MSTSGISSSGFSQLDSLLASTDQFNSEFKQLGSDLKNGNLAAAQEDFVTLSQEVLSSPFASSSASTSATASSTEASTATSSTVAASTSAASTSTASTSSSSASAATGSGTQSALSALAQDFQTLGQDLQSGDLAGAQQAFSQIQQAAQQGAQSIGGSHHRHHSHRHESSSGGSDSAASELQSLLTSISSASSSTSASSATATTGSATNSATNSATSTSASATPSAASSAASSGTVPATGSNSTGPLSAIEADFHNLGKALQSGNLAGAQQAFLQLTQDAQSLTGTHARPAENSGVRSSSELIQGLLSSQQTASAADGSSTAVSSLNVSA